MTQNNPYRYNDDADADIFGTPEESKSRRHSLDGNVCPSCNVVHHIAGLPDNIPQAVKDKILDFIEALPDEVLKRAGGMMAAEVPPQAKLIMDFMNFLTDTDDANHFGPMIRAVAEVLDEQTGGEITRRWEIYDLERRLITSHIALKTVNIHTEEARSDGAPEEVMSVLDLLITLMVDRISYITKMYREKCEQAGITPNESLINAGSYMSDLTPIVRNTMIDSIRYDNE